MASITTEETDAGKPGLAALKRRAGLMAFVLVH